MPFITLRQTNVVDSPNATIKGSPLTNSEVDNNFANINVEIGVLSQLSTSNTANLVSAVNELNSNSGVTPTTYGGTGVVPVFETNSKGRFVSVSNTSISASDITVGTLATGRGGTGQTTYTDGQLLIGNSSGGILDKATLTAGNATIITNGGGSITVGLGSSGVEANTYGGSSAIPAFTVDVNGRITAASNIAASFASTGKAIAMAIVFG